MLQIIVFLSGAVLMSLEMVGSRLLAPNFGSSIYVWGSLIVVVMAALTSGYYYGGRIADKYPNYGVMGAILAISGVFIGFLPFWVQPVNDSLSSFEPRIGSLLASLAFFFVPSVLLATISPYGIKMSSRSLNTIGNTAGNMSSISSAGSIVGTLLTSFFLIPVMGVRNIVHTLGLILLLMSVTVFLMARRGCCPGASEEGDKPAKKPVNIMVLFVILTGFLMVGLWVVTAGQKSSGSFNEVLYERDSLYHHIKVVQEGNWRRLHFDESFQSEMNMSNPLEMAFLYTSYLHLGVVAHPQPSRILFIGLGGGSAPRKFLHDYKSLRSVDAVEIDPEVVNVAKNFFDLPQDPRLRIIVQDGRLFIKNMAREIAAGRSAPYDMVIIDAYNSSSIPYHLTTREFVLAVRKVLAPNGVVVSNIIGAVTGPSSQLLRSMTGTVMSVFPQVYLFPVGGWRKDDTSQTNIILVATIDSKYWSANTWQKKAAELYQSGAIAEDVPEFVQSLVDGDLIRNKSWLAGIKLLTDDYAPVDTLKSPL